MKMRIAFSLMLLLALLFSGCKPPVAHDPSLWKELVVAEGDFKITMPPDAKRETQTIPRHSGSGSVDTVEYRSSGIDCYYLVGWLDLRPGSGYDFETAMNATAKQLGGKVADKNEVKVDEYPGVEFSMTVTRPDDGNAVERLVHVKAPEKNVNRAYWIRACGTNVDKSDQDVRKFLDSFELTLPKPSSK